MASFGLLACGLVSGLCVFFALILKWNDMRYRRKGLPPGTMGWPVFGETIEFLRYGPDFMKRRRARYGSFFQTHILGSPTVISMDPKLNRFILMNESKGLVPGYPQSTLDVLGATNIAAVHGSAHKYLRGSLLSLVGSSVIKDDLLMKVDKSMRSFTANWEEKTIDIQEKTEEMAFVVALDQILGQDQSNLVKKNFKRSFDKLVAGVLSLPINIPGTIYHKGIQGRKEVMKFLKQLVDSRRASPKVRSDILGDLMNQDGKYRLTDLQIYEQVVTILYSGYETVSTTTMMALKYLYDHPRALLEIRKEHHAIRKRKNEYDPIDWDDYKSMRITRAVIFETSRLATVVNGVLRKTMEDIDLDGFIIPKGWRIYVYTREINYDLFLYPDPFTFNPWRWLEDKKLESHDYCFLFGGGTRLCPGKELGIVKIAIFLHYFLTKYSWEEVGGEEILKFPRVEAPKGLHIKVSKFLN
ncbi:hypothetical protein K2173_015313 [Erythroxylum novogranatense]|uniref:Cytochrome P450 85A n=1 Tax=Erythroxylum novogranatense TaxID=1862640 RepID=A0AAV8T1K7_9ROSI|nr:hypothetical protein K2173_015313 [Erythroxylum novogranatense]